MGGYFLGYAVAYRVDESCRYQHRVNGMLSPQSGPGPAHPTSIPTH
jgi:hypothetical protein